MSRIAIRRTLAALGAAAVATALTGCQPAGSEPASDYVTEGKLTIATGNPA